MRLVARFAIGALVVLVLAGAALYLARRPIAAATVEYALARIGIEKPSVDVSAFSPSRIEISRLAAGNNPSAPDLRLDGVVARYDWRALLFDGKIKSILVENGAVVVATDENGAIDIAGWSPDPNAKRTPPIFRALVVRKLDVIARSPKGDARLVLSGAFDYQNGGAFDIDIAAQKAGVAAASIADASGKARLALGADGSIGLDGSLKSDVATPFGVARGVDADFGADLASWRGIFGDGAPGYVGEIVASVKSSSIDAASAPSLALLAGPGGAPIKTLAISGGVKASFDREGFSVSTNGGPLVVVADRGDRLVVEATDSALYESRSGATHIALEASLEGPFASGGATLKASSTNEGPWAIEASAALGEQILGPLSLGRFRGGFKGNLTDDRLAGEADIAALVKQADIGRMRITDMPATGRFDVAYDANAKTLTTTPDDRACFDFERAAFKMAEQDMEARVGAARLCPRGAPIIAIDFSDGTKARVAGALSAQSARYRLGKTVFDGAPPQFAFGLDYEPATQSSRLAGDFTGGRIVLNDAFTLTAAKGVFEGAIDGEKMAAKATLGAMTVAQKAQLAMVAPVSVAGSASLLGDIAQFDFRVSTPKGQPLGVGEGRHQVKTGRGEAVFDSGLLKFTPGLQPDRLLPALRGVISSAVGAMEGRARFEWKPNDIASSATIDLDDVSFGGPGVAVTRTEGVTGKVVFSALSPVATAGEQTLSIRKIDLDALKLENGSMRFAMPGDGTLKIVDAEFPWFDGTIGAYNSTMAIAGGKSATTLQIDGVNLAALLDYIKVEGLSGVGVVEGVLPVSFEGGKARINNGILSSKGPGVVRYEGRAADAASQSNEQSALAFEILRELRFEKLAATIDGPLDGTLNFNILFEGRSDIPVRTGGKTQRIDSPVKYRVTVNAPLLSLIEQAVLSTNVKLQIERAQKEKAAAEERQ
jgi:hypothetical protein